MKRIGDFEYNSEKMIRIQEIGKVYQGRDIRSGEKLAIKIINKNQFIGNQYKQNCLKRQRKILSNLSSPHIIKLKENIESRHHIFFIMEHFPDGIDLLNLACDDSSIDQQKVLSYITQLVHAFIELIRHGVIHRNLNPKNIFIKNGVLKIADFGCSCYGKEDSKFSRKQKQGIFCYPPQMLMKNQQYSYKCDIWSFGVLCYFIASKGKFPYKIMRDDAEQLKILKIQKRKEIKAEGFITNQLKDLIQGCLQFDEEKRFQWNDIFHHPYFKRSFEEIIDAKFGEFFQYNFIFSALKRLQKQHKMDVSSVLKGMGNDISLQSFVEKFHSLENSLNEEQLLEIFNKISSGKNHVGKKEIQHQFQRQEIFISKQKLCNQAKEKLKEYFSKFQEYLDEHQFDLLSIFRSLDVKDIGRIQFKQLVQFFEEIYRQFDPNEREKFKKCFELEKNNFLNWRNFYDPMSKLINCHFS